MAVIQLLLIYYGGSLFRTAGLTPRELMRVLGIAFLVVPADCARKLVLPSGGEKRNPIAACRLIGKKQQTAPLRIVWSRRRFCVVHIVAVCYTRENQRIFPA